MSCANQPKDVPTPAKEATTVLPAMGDRSPRVPEEAVLPPRPKPAGVVAVVGGTILVGDGTKIDNGTVVFSNGKISAVGKDVKAPKGAVVVDAQGKFVTPGLVDTHSHMGVYAVPHVGAHEDGNEMTDPTTPYVFSEHAFWPQDPAIEHAVAGGITTIQVLPGSGNVIGGRASTLKLRPRREARAMRFPGAPFGLKMACGENPKRVYGAGKKQQPMSRMGNIFKLRDAFIKAREYAFGQRAYELEYAEWKNKYDAYQEDDDNAAPGKEPRRPDRNLGAETLADVMEGKIKVHVHCYRADEMIQMIALGKELGFEITSFHHAVEAYKIADVLAKEGVAASIWADWWGFKMEAYDGVEENAAMVHAAGGSAIIHSDSNIGIQRLNQEAAKALFAGRRAGLRITDEEAIRWVTSNPAKALGIAEKTGVVKNGMMADLVVWDQSPFSIYAKADAVFIDGERVFDRNAKPRSWSDFEVGTEVEEVRP